MQTRKKRSGWEGEEHRERVRRCIELAAAGHSYAEIAELLGISSEEMRSTYRIAIWRAGVGSKGLLADTPLMEDEGDDMARKETAPQQAPTLDGIAMRRTPEGYVVVSVSVPLDAPGLRVANPGHSQRPLALAQAIGLLKRELSALVIRLVAKRGGGPIL